MSRVQIIVVAVLLNIFFVLISTPWTYGNTYFADSVLAWVIYYIVGFILSLFVTWAFLWAINILSNHEKHHLEEENHHHE